MPTYTNTRTLLGDQGALDALVSDTLTILADDTVQVLRSSAMNRRRQLQEVYLPALTRMATDVFNGCTSLKKVYIGLNSESVVQMSSNINADYFPGHALLYVPDALVTSYRENNRYASIRHRIFGVSDEGKYEWDDSEIADSWDTILANVQNGTAATIYRLGQYKRLDLYSFGNIEFQIIGINEDDLASGSGKAQLTWFPRSAVPSTIHRMNPSLSGTTPGTGAIGGMAYCEGQTWLDETVFPEIPEAVRAAIKSVRKYTRGYDTSGALNTDMVSTHKLFVPSVHEFSPLSGNAETMGPIYPIAFTGQTTRARRQTNGSSTVSYWTRTAYSQGNFYYINSNGAVTSSWNAANTGNLVFGFCT